MNIRRTERDNMDKQQAEDKRFHRVNLIWPLILILAVTLFSLFRGGSSEVVTQIDNQLLGIANATHNTFIPLPDILSVELVSCLDVGTPLSEEGDCVEYRNDEFGTYLLYTCQKADSYVVIRLADQVVVVNAKNNKRTENFYNELTQALTELE
ncbi:MAG: hypothetical protein ACI4O5_01295 [Oscillospiraceae bacterium]